jgi:acetate kinase
MNVLVINCGSSSLKFQLRRVAADAGRASDGALLAGGLVQGIGGTAEISLRAPDRAPLRSHAAVPDYAAAVRLALDWLGANGAAGGRSIEAVGHRFVHGGERLHRPAPIDAGVRTELQALEALAPLHNRPALAGVDAVQGVLGTALPNVAVFDTAFHHDLPDVARHYGLPRELTERHGIRRFGFHGTSCRSVLEQYGELQGTQPEGRVIVLHLGSGCSATAVRGGRSVDTTMGFTPLEGLLMGTRSGDLDPALALYLARQPGQTPESVERLLNTEAGLRGVSGLSNDLRDLLAAEARNPRARLAVELFCYRVRKTIGAYLAVLGGADAVLFTGGVGLHLAAIRERICAPLAWSGLRLDSARNEAARDGAAACIGAADAGIQSYVLPSDEERIIAWDTARCLG